MNEENATVPKDMPVSKEKIFSCCLLLFSFFLLFLSLLSSVSHWPHIGLSIEFGHPFENYKYQMESHGLKSHGLKSLDSF